MNTLLFLGTGPANGTKRGQTGKSKRMESSALVTLNTQHILIDATQFFITQSKKIKRLDAIVITHGHGDACWGIPYLDIWIGKHQQNKIPLYSHPTTIAIIRKRFPDTKNLDFIPVKPYSKLEICGTPITFFPVKHSMQKGYPTYGFLFGKQLAYASDVAGWNKKTEKIMQQAETLIIDGAMWQVTMPAHLTLPDIIPLLCPWPNKRLIFTQIGNTAPDYEILKEEIEKRCPKALPAYDGMQITF